MTVEVTVFTDVSRKQDKDGAPSQTISKTDERFFERTGCAGVEKS